MHKGLKSIISALLVLVCLFGRWVAEARTEPSSEFTKSLKISATPNWRCEYTLISLPQNNLCIFSV